MTSMVSASLGNFRTSPSPRTVLFLLQKISLKTTQRIYKLNAATRARYEMSVVLYDFMLGGITHFWVELSKDQSFTLIHNQPGLNYAMRNTERSQLLTQSYIKLTWNNLNQEFIGGHLLDALMKNSSHFYYLSLLDSFKSSQSVRR